MYRVSPAGLCSAKFCKVGFEKLGNRLIILHQISSLFFLGTQPDHFPHDWVLDNVQHTSRAGPCTSFLDPPTLPTLVSWKWTPLRLQRKLELQDERRLSCWINYWGKSHPLTQEYLHLNVFNTKCWPLLYYHFEDCLLKRLVLPLLLQEANKGTPFSSIRVWDEVR